MPTPVGKLLGRGEIFGGVSRANLYALDGQVYHEQRRVLGIGIGLQLDGGGVGARPYGYVAPTFSYFSFTGTGDSSRRLGLSGGVGVKLPANGRQWFAELSWRGHGDFPFDGTALAALTAGIGL